jgi:hypothetical protein
MLTLRNRPVIAPKYGWLSILVVEQSMLSKVAFESMTISSIIFTVNEFDLSSKTIVTLWLYFLACSFVMSRDGARGLRADLL